MSLRRQWTTIDVSVEGWRWRVNRLTRRAAEIASKHRISFAVRWLYRGPLKVRCQCHFEGESAPTQSAADEFVDWINHA